MQSKLEIEKHYFLPHKDLNIFLIGVENKIFM